MQVPGAVSARNGVQSREGVLTVVPLEHGRELEIVMVINAQCLSPGHYHPSLSLLFRGSFGEGDRSDPRSTPTAMSCNKQRSAMIRPARFGGTGT